MKRWILFMVLIGFIAGCSSDRPSKKPFDKDQIKRNADQSIEDLKKEEDQRGD